jgi:hypothetical protein
MWTQFSTSTFGNGGWWWLCLDVFSRFTWLNSLRREQGWLMGDCRLHFVKVFLVFHHPPINMTQPQLHVHPTVLNARKVYQHFKLIHNLCVGPLAPPPWSSDRWPSNRVRLIFLPYVIRFKSNGKIMVLQDLPIVCQIPWVDFVRALHLTFAVISSTGRASLCTKCT